MALYNVALCYENGFGIAKDVNKAKEWYEKSAEYCKDNRAINKLSELNNKTRTPSIGSKIICLAMCGFSYS